MRAPSLPSLAVAFPLARTTVFLSLLATSLVGCGAGCPEGTTLEKGADLCVGMPSGFQRTSQNGADGQDSFAYGPKGRMVMFVRRQTADENTRTRQQLAARAADPPKTLKIIESGATDAFAYQLYQYNGRPTFELESTFVDAGHGGQSGRCTATFASESEARDVLSACRRTRFAK